MNDFCGKRVAIIGCSRGVGRALAEKLAASGATLLLADRNQAIHAVADGIRSAGGNAQSLVADVGEPRACTGMLEEFWGGEPLDGLVYMPRGRQPRPFSELTFEGWNNDLSVALSGACFSARAAAPLLKKSAEAGGTPAIVFVSSVLSTFIGAESPGYHVAKAGIDQLTRYLAVEFGPLGIRVNAIQLGFMVPGDHEERYWSEGNKGYRDVAEVLHPLRKVGFSKDFVEPAGFLLSSRAGFITGQVLCVDGGLSVHDHSTLFNKARAALQEDL